MSDEEEQNEWEGAAAMANPEVNVEEQGTHYLTHAVPSRYSIDVSLKEHSQASHDEEMVREIQSTNQVSSDLWSVLKDTDAVMAISCVCNRLPIQFIKTAIVDYVKETGNLKLKAEELLKKIPEQYWWM